MPAELDPQGVFDLYDQEGATSDAIITRCSPADRPAAWPAGLGPSQSVREIILHVITETATHADTSTSSAKPSTGPGGWS